MPCVGMQRRTPGRLSDGRESFFGFMKSYGGIQTGKSRLHRAVQSSSEGLSSDDETGNC